VYFFSFLCPLFSLCICSFRLVSLLFMFFIFSFLPFFHAVSVFMPVIFIISSFPSMFFLPRHRKGIICHAREFWPPPDMENGRYRESRRRPCDYAFAYVVQCSYLSKVVTRNVNYVPYLVAQSLVLPASLFSFVHSSRCMNCRTQHD
jgi:hypothetical protein